MIIFDLLKLNTPLIKSENCKIHLAVRSGSGDPLELYLSGKFEEWQSWQSKKNFERKYIISLLKLPGKDKWLFAGVYESESNEYIEDEKCYKYKTKVIEDNHELSGRLIVTFERPGRQSYLSAENWDKKIYINEFKPQKIVIEEFSDYNKVLLTKSKLDLIVSQNIPSWEGALSNVSGVYIITDKATGRIYVGSATGESGIWQRWCEYSENGHGGNIELIALLKEKGSSYCSNFQYSILEIADTHSSSIDVLDRESHWKNILCSKVHGYNAN